MLDAVADRFSRRIRGIGIQFDNALPQRLSLVGAPHALKKPGAVHQRRGKGVVQLQRLFIGPQRDLLPAVSLKLQGRVRHHAGHGLTKLYAA